VSSAVHNVRAAGALLDALAEAGVRYVCMAPGSRSSPLVLAADRHPDIVLRMVTDERSAAYFALGLAKACGKPVVVGCTSGTAIANFGPAVVEASLAHVPLVVLTADRPPEQHDLAAAQTIRQSGLFAHHAVWSIDAPVPDASFDVETTFRTLGARLASTAQARQGPVHANLPFREPLWDETVDALLTETRTGDRPTVRVAAATSPPEPQALAQLGARLGDCKRGLVIAGPRDIGTLDTDAAVRIAELLGWPILADGLSELRPLVATNEYIFDTHEVLARTESTRNDLRPDAIIRLGGVPTSKLLGRLLADWRVEPHVLLTARSDWPDPNQVATDIVRGDPSVSLRALTDAQVPASGRAWIDAWRSASARARSVLDEAARTQRFEGAVAHAVVSSLQAGDQFVVGNSMPVRDLDLFASDLAPGVVTHANRGANGIDGVTSMALGVAAATGRQTVALIGDLSFAHDLSALQIAKRHAIDVTIVIPNNDGGGIFNFLPKPADGFEQLFATPHGLDLGAIVRAHGFAFEEVTDIDDLSATLSERPGGLRIVEIRIEREHNAQVRTATIAAAVAAVDAQSEAAA